MSLSPEIREQVRQRARCACEFCGVTETDVGSVLTIDHFQPHCLWGHYLILCCERWFPNDWVLLQSKYKGHREAKNLPNASLHCIAFGMTIRHCLIPD